MAGFFSLGRGGNNNNNHQDQDQHNSNNPPPPDHQIAPETLFWYKNEDVTAQPYKGFELWQQQEQLLQLLCSRFLLSLSLSLPPSLPLNPDPDIALEELAEAPASQDSDSIVNEIERCKKDRSSRRSSNYWEDYRINGVDFVLKRSHSFGFERSSASVERMMVTEPATASPWRYRSESFWSKRPSPFGSLTKARVFSFRSTYRGGVNMKSPFFRRKCFFPLTEPSARFSGGGAGGSSRRSKSMTSPMFMRSSAMSAFSSSRLRCGDPEALLSPERFNRR